MLWITGRYRTKRLLGCYPAAEMAIGLNDQNSNRVRVARHPLHRVHCMSNRSLRRGVTRYLDLALNLLVSGHNLFGKKKQIVETNDTAIVQGVKCYKIFSLMQNLKKRQFFWEEVGGNKSMNSNPFVVNII